MINWDDPLNINKENNKPIKTLTESYAKSDALNNSLQQQEKNAEIEVKIPVDKSVDSFQKTAGNGGSYADKSTGKEVHNSKKKQQKTNRNVEPIKASDKRVINGLADVNQLAPFKYPWAWEYFLNANKNHWTPLDINMAQDVHDYQYNLTDNEKHVYENVLAYLTTSDILAMRNIGLAVMEKMTAPELQIYQARQVYEEALHTWTYQHCIETIGLDQGEIYNRYRVVPEINAKIQLANRRLDSILRSDIDLTDQDELNNFVMAYSFFAGIFEGCWFYNGFTPIFSLQRRGLMKGTSEQLQYIMRDEVMHASFGIRVVKQIMLENEVTLDPKAIREMWDESEAAEIGYAQYILKDPILGYSANDHIEQFRFIANRRARQLGFEEPFPGAKNCTPWLDEQANMRKEKNFFETRVTEYQTGGALDWD